MPTRRHVLGYGAAVGFAASAQAEASDAARTPTVSQAVGPKVAPYKASCVPNVVRPVFDASGNFLPEALETNVSRVAALVRRGADEVGSRLYAFSEFCLQVAPKGATVGAWEAAAITVPGPEIDRIATAAQAARAFVSVNVAERIASFPGRYFLSGVILGPTGDAVLNYRKLYDLSNKTRPGDVLEAWIDRFGADSLFPVADTEIGRLASAVALDVNWPEVIRGFVFNGAEVILNPTASPGNPSGTGPDIRIMVRRVRAFENLAYLVQTNIGPLDADDSAAPEARHASEIIDFTGTALASDATGSERFLTATIDIEALRHARTSADARNWLAQLQIPLHLPGYASARFAGVNGFGATPVRDADDHRARLRDTIADLIRRGVLRAPG